MMRSLGLLIMLGLAAALALCGCGRGSQAEETAAVTVEEKATNVAVTPVVPEDLREVFTLPGSAEAWEDLTLAAEVAGPVRWVGPREGDTVRQGEALLRIDPDTLKANLARAEAEYAMQNNQLERMARLAEQKFVSQQEYEAARKAAEVAAAELRRCRVALDQSTLNSPVDGVLDRWLVDRGEYVAPGQAVAVVVQVDRLKVTVDVPEKDIPFLAVGQSVEVVPAAIDGRPAAERRGRIIHLGFKADPVTRTYPAKIEVDNRDRGLRPGMILRVGLTRRLLPQAVAVPLYALLERGDGKAVFVEENGLARLRPIEAGAVLGDRVVIREGLAAGERLIVQGQQLLADGARVAVTGN